ncbi:MAG: hypothetical protein WDA27_11180 [Actinomycetota bacterium]
MKAYSFLVVWGAGVLLYGLLLVAVTRGPIPERADMIARGVKMGYRRAIPYVVLVGGLALLVGTIGVVTQATISTPTPRYFAATGGYGAVVAAVGIGFGVLARMRSAPERARRRELLRTAGRWTRRVGVLAALAGTLGRILVGHW